MRSALKRNSRPSISFPIYLGIVTILCDWCRPLTSVEEPCRRAAQHCHCLICMVRGLRRGGLQKKSFVLGAYRCRWFERCWPIAWLRYSVARFILFSYGAQQISASLRLTDLYVSAMCHFYGLWEADIKHKINNEPSAKQTQCHWAKYGQDIKATHHRHHIQLQ